MDVAFWIGEITALGVVLTVMARLLRAELRNQHRPPIRGPAAPRRRWAGRRHPRQAPCPPCPAVVQASQWAPFVVRPDTDLADLQRQYRLLACAHHPDRGGDPQVMAHVNLLYRQLRRQHAGTRTDR